MSVLELTNEQVVSLIRQLPPKSKREALIALAQEPRQEELMRKGEAQLRRHAAARGLDWDRLSDQEREDFVDRLLHED